MTSPEYIELKTRLNHLKSTLPKSSLTNLNQKQRDHVKAVALHQHAACERYIEERTEQVALAAVEQFTNHGIIGRTAKHLCVFPFLSEFKNKPDLHKAAAVYGSVNFGIFIEPAYVTSNHVQISKLLNVGFQAYKKMWAHNHGIAIKYQFKMLAALGVDIGEFDPGFSSSISKLAGVRGAAAHSSLVIAQTAADPTDIKNWTPQLISGFKSLDEELDRLPTLMQ